MVSDASDIHASIYHDGGFQVVNQFEFDEFERSASSGYRELLAVIKTLENPENSEFFQSLNKRRIYWQT